MPNKERCKEESGIHGKYYERGITLWMALKYLAEKSVKDYWIFCNPSEIEKFDDIILHVEYKTGESQVYFFQLKHKQQSEVPFHTNQFASGTQFKLEIYQEEYKKVTKTESPILKKLGINENAKTFFCIYTNQIRNKEEEKHKTVYDLQFVRINEINNIVDSSNGMEQSIYKVLDPEKKCDEYFLKDFYLWLNQMDEENIVMRINKDFQINETSVDSLLYYFVRQFEPKNNKKFTRKDMIRKMLNIFFEKYEIPNMSILVEEENSVDVLDIIKSYDVTVIKQIDSEQRIWRDILKSLDNSTGNDTKEKDLDDVCESKLPFFLKTSNILFDSYKNYFLDAVCISVIFFVDEKRNISLDKNGKEVLEFITDLKDDLVASISKHSPKLSFQGKEEIDLLKFVKGYNKPSQQVDIDIFFKYLNQTIEIGRKESVLDYYIERKINVPVMKLEKKLLAENKRISCIQIFCNCPEKKGYLLGLVNISEFIRSQKQNKKNTPTMLFSVFPFSKKIIEQLDYLKYAKIKHIHIFERINNKDLFIPVYRVGYGECPVMRKLTFEPIDDMTVIDFCKQNKINVISNNAGEGKTIFLKHISRYFPNDTWIVNINMSNSSNLVAAKDFNNFIQEIFHLEKRNTREKYHDVLFKIYNICKDKKKFVWLVDDYEEIGTLQLTNVLKEVQFAEIKIWIASRPFKKRDLESNFRINVMEMIPITLEEQTEFFEKYFRGNNFRALESISTIRQKMNETFIGIFQQMSMLAEIFKSNQMPPNSEYAIIDVYHKFIDLKVKLHKKEKHHRDIVKIMLQKFALAHFFSDEVLKKFFDIKELYVQMTFFKEEYTKGTIVTYITEGNRAIFSHETYAEYLVAEWLTEKLNELSNEQGRLTNLENMIPIIKILYTQKFRTIRYFFDAIMTKGIPILSAAVNKQYDLLEILYTACPRLISQKDCLGRTLLHFLIGNESQCDIQTNMELLRQHTEENAIFSECERYVFLSLPKRTEPSTKEHEFETWYPRCNHKMKCDFDLSFNLEKFILLSGSLELLDRMLSKKQLKLNIVKREHKYLLLGHAIINRFNNILREMDLEDLNITKIQVQNHSFMSLLHLSAYFNNWEGFQILFEIENNLEKWGDDNNKNTVLHTASRAADVRFINTLCSKGIFSTSFLNKTNNSGLSPLHSLCSVSSTEWIIKILHNRPELNVNLPCKEGNTPFLLSVISGNSELSEILFSLGAKIDHKNKNGFSALHYACIRSFHQIVEDLLQWGATVNLKNKYGLTPLCFAVINGNSDIVKLLLNSGADQNIADNRGWTILHHAVKRNNNDILRYLPRQGANPNTKNYRKRTPLMLAKSVDNREAIQEILAHESRENLLKASAYAKKINYERLSEMPYIF